MKSGSSSLCRLHKMRNVWQLHFDLSIVMENTVSSNFKHEIKHSNIINEKNFIATPEGFWKEKYIISRKPYLSYFDSELTLMVRDYCALFLHRGHMCRCINEESIDPEYISARHYLLPSRSMTGNHHSLETKTLSFSTQGYVHSLLHSEDIPVTATCENNHWWSHWYKGAPEMLQQWTLYVWKVLATIHTYIYK